MATATELIKECKICALTFVNPKLLPCHHTFCEDCVKKMTKGSRLVCPNCRKECHAREIVSDFRLDEFLHVFEEQEERLTKPKTETITTGTGTTAEIASESLESVSSKEWTRHHSVTVPNLPSCLRLIHVELWQCHSGGITVYDAALQQSRNIDSDDMGWVHDVASLLGGEVVVAANNGLFRMTASGQHSNKVAQGCFAGVVQHRGRVYAVNPVTCTVHVYNDDWAECFSFSVNATKDYMITLDISQDLLYACLSNDNRLDVFTLSGELQFSTGSEGSGAAGLLDYPRICATDTAGTALIADFRNDHLQVLSARRQWSTVSLQPPVKRPRSALLLGGKLYISSLDTKALYMYE